ncbi:MAG: family 78 glycoside hydrolase catalytic domain, partial [Limisphaerales bacterium]
WKSVTVVDCPGYHLFAQMAPREHEQAALKPVSITSTNGVWLVNFGRCIDGWPKITMRENHPGDKVRIAYFQMTGQRKAAGWDEYICHGGTETWDADFGRYTSFQVMKITGYAGQLKASDIRGIWAYCDADVAGRFHCSSDLANRVYKMCERSARQNVQQGIIAVDAQREQLPWLADSWNIGNVLLYNDLDTMIIDKVVRDFAGEQMTNGYIRNVSPGHGFEGADGHGRIPEWAMYWPRLLWRQYLFSGDQTLLRQMAPRLARLLDWLKPYQDPATGLLNPRKMWRISEFAGGNMPSGGYNVATACEYYENLRIASRVFSALGQTGRSAAYLRQAEKVKSGINSNLLMDSPDGEYYLARTDTHAMYPLASAWPLRFNIEPMADRSNILATILTPGTPDIGGYGGDAFYSGLLNAGAGAFVMRDLARYRPMLDGNEANWEQFGLAGEVNHAWTSYPGYLLQKYVLGIQPTSGGFATFDVRPDTGGLTFAEGAVPTVKGLITTHWAKKNHGGFILSIHVPANTRASVDIPKFARAENFTVTESGEQLWPPKPPMNDPGVLAVSEKDSSIKCLVRAGDYHFRETP